PMEAGAHLFANVRKGEIHLDGQPAGASSADLPAAPAEAPPAPHEATAPGPAEAPAPAAAPAPVAATESAPVPHAGHPAARSRTLALANPEPANGSEPPATGKAKAAYALR